MGERELFGAARHCALCIEATQTPGGYVHSQSSRVIGSEHNQLLRGNAQYVAPCDDTEADSRFRDPIANCVLSLDPTAQTS